MGIADRDASVAKLGAVLLLVLTLAAVVSFAVTRAARAVDDVVNTVVVTPRLDPGVADAEIRFDLTEGDAQATVQIVTRSGEPVRTLVSEVPLDPGPQALSWNGLDQDRNPVEPGSYAIRVILGEQQRDIQPPGLIRVGGGPAG